jgi:hypothetical protein
MKRIIIASALALVCLGASAQAVDNTVTRTTKPRTAKIAKKKPVKLDRVKREVKIERDVPIKVDRNAQIRREEPVANMDTLKVKKRRITPRKPNKPTK